jgi:uncharacterized protein (DUF427 family)
VRVELGGRLVADSTRALRVLETSHPPTIYVPSADVRLDALVAGGARPTVCEYKGVADYLAPAGGGAPVAWSYRDPSPGYEALRGHIAFYPGRVDAAWLDDERVSAQPGDFYGGWISGDLIGPFKGAPGTSRW